MSRVPDAAMLLRVLLIHWQKVALCANGSAPAEGQLVEVSDVALLKRLKLSGDGFAGWAAIDRPMDDGAAGATAAAG